MDKRGKSKSVRNLACEFDKEKTFADKMTRKYRIDKCVPSLRLIPNLGRIVKQIEAMKIAK